MNLQSKKHLSPNSLSLLESRKPWNRKPRNPTKSCNALSPAASFTKPTTGPLVDNELLLLSMVQTSAASLAKAGVQVVYGVHKVLNLSCECQGLFHFKS